MDNPYLDWFLALGDNMTLNQLYQVPNPEDHSVTYLVPHLQEMKSSNRVIGQYFKDLTDDCSKKYNHMRVESMPEDVNAASVRQGCVNELLTHMPEHFVAIATGHERKNSSAMFEYFKPERTGLNPSGTYQGGDQPPPWGQLGQSRIPPSFHCLKKEITDRIMNMIDDMFNIDDLTHFTLKSGGHLRIALQHGFASQIMYYEKRVKCGKFKDYLC